MAAALNEDKVLYKALNGYNGAIRLCGKHVYFKSNCNPGLKMSELGALKDKDAFICSGISSSKDQEIVKKMLTRWQLYENGWLVEQDDSGVFNYLRQVCYDEPEALKELQESTLIFVLYQEVK